MLTLRHTSQVGPLIQARLHIDMFKLTKLHVFYNSTIVVEAHGIMLSVYVLN